MQSAFVVDGNELAVTVRPRHICLQIEVSTFSGTSNCQEFWWLVVNKFGPGSLNMQPRTSIISIEIMVFLYNNRSSFLKDLLKTLWFGECDPPAEKGHCPLCSTGSIWFTDQPVTDLTGITLLSRGCCYGRMCTRRNRFILILVTRLCKSPHMTTGNK